MPTFEKEKTKTLILLILNEFGSISKQNLNNIIYYLDVCHLVENGRYITKTLYYKTKGGFVSKDILSLIEEMKEHPFLVERNGFLTSFVTNSDYVRKYFIYSDEFSLSDMRIYIEFLKNSFEFCNLNLSDSLQSVVFNPVWEQKKLHEEMTIHDSAKSTGDTALIEFLKTSYY